MFKLHPVVKCRLQNNLHRTTVGVRGSPRLPSDKVYASDPAFSIRLDLHKLKIRLPFQARLTRLANYHTVLKPWEQLSSLMVDSLDQIVYSSLCGTGLVYNLNISPLFTNSILVIPSTFLSKNKLQLQFYIIHLQWLQDLFLHSRLQFCQHCQCLQHSRKR